ncbi:hypothetical protein BV20DRAFT_783681 [Pilatotrama ljubarskyi]|nr:hypothetical protein BV20DRAFT_783681 [Pilatotrama ljubarskyi]
MSQVGYNIWGVVAGAIGTFTILPTIALWILGSRPTSKLKVLEALLDETEKMFQQSIEEGLIHDEDELARLHAWLWMIKVRVDDMRLHVYQIHTWKDELAGWWNGLSGKIDIIYQSTSKLRTKITKTSVRERRALAAAGHTSKLASLSAIRGRAVHSPPPYSLGSLQLEPLGLGAQPLASLVPPFSSERGFPSAAQAPAALESTELGADLPCRPSPNQNLPLTPSSMPREMSGVPDECEHAHATEVDPPCHVLSDADLKDLLSLALAESRACARADDVERRRRRATRQDLLQKFGRELFAPGSSSGSGRESVLPKRTAGGGRFKAFSRVLSRTYGVPARGSPSGARCTDLDPQLPEPQLAGDDACDGDEPWLDV